MKKIEGMLYIVGAVAVALLCIGAIIVIKNSENQSGEREDTGMQPPNGQQVQQKVTEQTKGDQLSHGQCEGEEKPLLTHAPMDMQDVTSIIPYGLVVGAHVTPIDHQYFEPKDRSLGADAYPVYAMADATIVDIQTRPSQFGAEEYRLVFSMSCKLFYYYDLVTSLTPELEQKYKNKGNSSFNIPVIAGQKIGNIGGQTLDFAVWDTDSTLKGFISPEMYKHESWKIHTVDPLPYYTQLLRTELLKKYIRTQEPISGKIDHDIPKTAQGNWFEKETSGYGGTPPKYWSTHLSLAPNHIDPTLTMASIGDVQGKAQQFAIKKTDKQPAQITQQDGLVAITLHQLDYTTKNGQTWDRIGNPGQELTAVAQNYVAGCAKIQVLPNEELKFEVTTAGRCKQQEVFSSKAKIYER